MTGVQTCALPILLSWDTQTVPDGEYKIKVELWGHSDWQCQDEPTRRAMDMSNGFFTVDNNDDSPVANFSWQAEGLTVTFTDESTDNGMITYRAWDFTADGYFDDYGKIVTYTFPAEGTYTIGLFVQDNDLNTDAITKNVSVEKEKKADLVCTGNLEWDKAKPGSVVTSSFTVKNNGDAESLLDWRIEDYPTWGNWTFAPFNGRDLTPAQGPVTVEVFIIVPDVEESLFTGEVFVINEQDGNDYETIFVSVQTPKNKQNQFPWAHFLFHRFSLIFEG